MEGAAEIIRKRTEDALEWGARYVNYWEIYCNECEDGNPGACAGFWMRRPDGNTSKWYQTISQEYISEAENSARFISQSVPGQMESRKRYNVTIRFKNTGTSTWTREAIYKLGSQNPHDNEIWGRGRVPLDPDEQIETGEEKEFLFEVTAPEPGTYDFQWRVVQEQVGWFGDFTESIEIDVVAVCIHRADQPPCNGRIDTDELFDFVELWKQNQATLDELMEAIGLWKERQ